MGSPGACWHDLGLRVDAAGATGTVAGGSVISGVSGECESAADRAPRQRQRATRGGAGGGTEPAEEHGCLELRAPGLWYVLAVDQLFRIAKAAGVGLLRLRSNVAGFGNEAAFRRFIRSGRVTMGVHSYGVPRVIAFSGDRSRLAIGKYVSIGSDVEFLLGGNHRTDWISAYPFRIQWGLAGAREDGHPSSRGDTRVGNDVWIGRGARILSGVRIEDGAVIGAYSVVTRDVPPYAIVAGNPAREVRRRFAENEIDALLSIAWWEWGDSEILQLVPLLCSGRVAEFISAAKSFRE